MKSAARPRTFAPASTPVRVRARVRANPNPNPDANPSQATHLRTGEQPGDRPVASGHRAEGGEGAAPWLGLVLGLGLGLGLGLELGLGLGLGLGLEWRGGRAPPRMRACG
mgnify:CR=1 FL=1